MNKLDYIMLVEDDEDIREIAEIVLTQIGKFKVTQCQSGKEALEKLEHESPQLLLLDVMMPELDGPATLVQLKMQKNNIPVIFMTARVQSHEIEEYLQMGAIGVISKPFNPTTLCEEIVTLWNTHQEFIKKQEHSVKPLHK